MYKLFLPSENSALSEACCTVPAELCAVGFQCAGNTHFLPSANSLIRQMSNKNTQCTDLMSQLGMITEAGESAPNSDLGNKDPRPPLQSDDIIFRQELQSLSLLSVHCSPWGSSVTCEQQGSGSQRELPKGNPLWMPAGFLDGSLVDAVAAVRLREGASSARCSPFPFWLRLPAAGVRRDCWELAVGFSQGLMFLRNSYSGNPTAQVRERAALDRAVGCSRGTEEAWLALSPVTLTGWLVQSQLVHAHMHWGFV